MGEDRTGLLITLPARSENVAVVRHAVAGLAERLGMEEPGVGDLKTVVTEACMNVVVHAYPRTSRARFRSRSMPEPDGLTVDGPRLRRGHPPAPRRRPAEPADRPDADRRALQQLRDLRRPRPRHRDQDAPAAAAGDGGEAQAEPRPDRRPRRGGPS